MWHGRGERRKEEDENQRRKTKKLYFHNEYIIYISLSRNSFERNKIDSNWYQNLIKMTAISRRKRHLDLGKKISVRGNVHEASLLSRPIVRDTSGLDLQAHKSLARFTLGTGDLAAFPRDSRDTIPLLDSFISIADWPAESPLKRHAYGKTGQKTLE